MFFPGLTICVPSSLIIKALKTKKNLKAFSPYQGFFSSPVELSFVLGIWLL